MRPRSVAMPFLGGSRRPSPSEPAPRRIHRLRRWMLGGAAAVAGLALLAVAVVAIALGSLDRPWLKGRLKALAHRSAQIDVTYASARLSLFSGLEVDGLVLESPPEFRAAAPVLARVGHLSVRWSLASLFGSPPRIDAVTIADAALTVAVDEHGRTSFDPWSSPNPPPSPPLSGLLAAHLRAAPPLKHLRLDGSRVALVRVEQGRVAERDDVRGLSATVDVEPVAGGWGVHAALGVPASPVDLTLTREHPDVDRGEARARVWLTVVATPAQVDAAFDARVLEQTLVSTLHGDEALHLEATARFDPDARVTEVSLHDVRTGDGTATAQGVLRVPDAGDPVLRQAKGDVDVARLLRWVPAGLVPATVERAHVRYALDSVVLGSPVRLSPGGSVELEADLAGVATTAAASPIAVGEAHLTLHGEQAAGGEMSAALRLGLDHLRVGGATPVDAQIDVALHDALPNLSRPESSRGVAHVQVKLGDVQASLDATKEADAVDFALEVDASSLRALRPFLPPAWSREASWDRMTLKARSSGRIEALASAPQVREETSIELAHPAFGSVAARSLELAVRSHGDALRHEAEVDLRARGLALGAGAGEDAHLSLSGDVDRPRRSARLQLTAEGRTQAHLSAALGFDSARRAVTFDVDGRFAHLASLAPFVSQVRALEGFDLSSLGFSVAARGALLGAVSSVGADGRMRFESQPSRTAAVEGTFDVKVDHLRWVRGATAVSTPAAAWHTDLRVVGAQRTLKSDLRLDSLHLDLGEHAIDLVGLSDQASATVTGDLLDPTIDLDQRAEVHAVRQDLAPAYPVGDVTFGLSAQGDPDGLVHIAEMKLVNGAGGTSLSVTGGVELGSRRRRLAVTTDVAQDLAPLSVDPRRFAGRGRLAVRATLESPDLSRFRARVDLKADDVHARSPKFGVEVEALSAQVPVTVAFDVDRTGIELGRDARVNSYSMLRFADQHPLLRRSGFLSLGSLKTPFFSIAPLIGNLEIEQNVVSLRQFEMGLRGGRVTGQCAFDWDGPKSTVELHVRATGVQSTHGEPFDGNIAVTIAAADRTVEGRAEILRIGPRHLLDLLDMEDPMRVDPAMNRVRTALSFGYPDRLRLVFDHGFASAKLELGGLARLISIDEIRGIPMGPIVDRFLGPVLDAKRTP